MGKNISNQKQPAGEQLDSCQISWGQLNDNGESLLVNYGVNTVSRHSSSSILKLVFLTANPGKRSSEAR